MCPPPYSIYDCVITTLSLAQHSYLYLLLLSLCALLAVISLSACNGSSVETHSVLIKGVQGQFYSTLFCVAETCRW